MPRSKSINFYQNRPKIKIFSQKNTNFLSNGDAAPRPPKQPPTLEISGYASDLAVEWLNSFAQSYNIASSV